MHEFHIMKDLMDKIQWTAKENGGTRVKSIKVTLGAHSHMSPDHFKDHFARASKGTIAQDCSLDIDVSNDAEDEDALSVRLETIELETE